MANLKPIKQLVSKARKMREEHLERHRPTGFGFAIADSIDYLDKRQWEMVTASNSVFLSRDYLRVIETAGPANLRQRYALIFKDREPVAAVAAQAIKISAAVVPKSPRKAVSSSLKRLEANVLVCGNLLSWGPHGVAFAPGVDRSLLWPAVADALYRIRRADRLFGSSDLIMVKDVTDEHAADAGALARFSYRPVETEPNMVLELKPNWRSFDDYLASLTSSYRRTARKIAKDIEAAGFTLERLSEVDRYAGILYSLYLQVHERQKLRLVTLSPEFLPALASTLGEAFRCTIIRRNDQVVGFVTTLKDGDTGVGYYIGFDGSANTEAPIYFRLLQAVIDDSLQLGCRRVSLGRTALEPKAGLGARPAPMRIWLRHRIPAVNLVVRSLLQTISHEDAPERNPFK